MQDSATREVFLTEDEDEWIRKALAGRDFNDWAVAAIRARWPSRLFRAVDDGRSRPIRRSVQLTAKQDAWIEEALDRNHSTWTLAARDALVSEAVDEVSRSETRRLMGFMDGPLPAS